MKKKIGFSVLFLIIPLFILTSCGKDKNDNIEDDPIVEDYNYVCTDTECYLAGINNVDAFFKNLTDEWVFVPSNYNDKPVTKINKDAFTITPIVKLKISDNIEVIEESAFRGCYKLNEVILPDTLKLLGSYSFAGCKVESLMIPKNLKTIEEGALACDDLKDVYYNGTIEDWCKIEFEDKNSNPMNYASNFYILDPNGDIEYNGNKYSLVTEIEIPNTITSIGNYQFYGFNNVTSITIPDSVINIGEYSFSYCSSITNLNVLSNVENIGSGAFKGCSSLTNVVIPSGVTSIASYTFSECSSLTNMTIPSGVTSIGSYAFSKCSNLISIDIPSEVTSIDSYAFSECNSIEIISLPVLESFIDIDLGSLLINSREIRLKNGRIINDRLFRLCSNLETILIPNTITKMGLSTFSRCDKLTSVYYNGTIEDWCKIEFEDKNSNPMKYAKNFYILDSNGDIEYNGKKYSLVTEIEIPNTITSIGNYQFYGFNNVTSITIPKGVSNIGRAAFIDCSNLINIEISNSVISIGQSAFYSCENLENVYYDGTLEDWCNISFEPSSFNLMDYAKNFYILDSNGDVEYNGNKYSLVTEIEIPNTITSIGNYQFYGFNDVTSVIIPDSVTSIGVDAFSECSSLINIKIPSGVTKILSSFRGCSSLSSIIIPKSIEYISGGSFFGCSGLENVYYEGTYNDWQRIYLYEQDDSCLIEATIYYYSETMPTEDGNYWHYDENNNVVIWQ